MGRQRRKKIRKACKIVRVGVLDQGDVLETGTELVWTVLVEETVKRRASRASVQPEHDRVGGFVAGGRDEDVVVVLRGSRQVDVARVHLYEGGFLISGETRAYGSAAAGKVKVTLQPKKIRCLRRSYEVRQASHAISGRLSKSTCHCGG